VVVGKAAVAEHFLPCGVPSHPARCEEPLHHNMERLASGGRSMVARRPLEPATRRRLATMLDMPMAGTSARYLCDLDPRSIDVDPIATGAHCFGCTAGADSSCGGSLT